MCVCVCVGVYQCVAPSFTPPPPLSSHPPLFPPLSVVFKLSRKMEGKREREARWQERTDRYFQLSNCKMEQPDQGGRGRPSTRRNRNAPKRPFLGLFPSLLLIGESILGPPTHFKSSQSIRDNKDASRDGYHNSATPQKR